MLSPTVARGSSDANGSWNTICIWARRRRSSGARRGEEVLPVVADRAGVGLEQAQQRRPSVLLPQPDSPTRPITSPARTSRSTSVTAWTCPWARPSAPGADREGLHEGPGLEQHRLVDVAASVAPCRCVTGVGRLGDVAVEEAAHLVARRHLDQRRHLLDAAGQARLDPGLAPRREAAAGRQVDEVRHAAGDDRQLVLAATDHRHRTDETLRVRDAGATRTAPASSPPPRSGRRTSPPPARPSRPRRRGRG